MNKITGSKLVLALGCAAILTYFVWNLDVIENVVGRFMASDPSRAEDLYVELKSETDSTLLKLMQHGDLNKAGVATRILAERSNPGLYDLVLEQAKNGDERLSALSRSLLVSLNSEKAVAYFLGELKRSDLPDNVRHQMIGILVNQKAPEVYPYLLEEANQPDAWRKDVVRHLGVYGDPKALPLLYRLKSNIPNDPQSMSSRLALKTIDTAISDLEQIKAASSLQ